jgi:hypothetical protein
MPRAAAHLARAAVAAIALAWAPRAAAQPTPDPPPRPPPSFMPVNVSVLHPLATNFAAPDVCTALSLGVVLDRVGCVGGAQIAPIAYVSRDVRGAQIGAATLVDGPSRGLALAGVFALAGGPVEGASIAGFASWSRDTFDGVAVGGVFAYAQGDVTGLQLAGFATVTRGEIDGAQIGLVNVGRIRGAQIGVLNVSSDAHGAQIGVLNVARHLEGLQLGAMNLAGHLEGESLGVASLPREGGIHPAAWASTSLPMNVGLKLASKVVYSLLAGGLGKDGDHTVYGAGLSFGVRFPLLTDTLDGLAISTDVGGLRLARVGLLDARHDELYRSRILLSYSLDRHLSVFAGGGLRVAIHGDAITDARFGPEIVGGVEL